MKRTLFVFIIIFVVANVTYGQNGPPLIKAKPDELAKILQTKLNLTNNQVNQVIAIYQSSGPDPNQDIDDPLPQSQAISDKILAVLDPQQAALFKRLIAQKQPPPSNSRATTRTTNAP